MKTTAKIIVGLLIVASMGQPAFADTIKRTDNADGTTTFDHGPNVGEHVHTHQADRIQADYEAKGHTVEVEIEKPEKEQPEKID